MRSVGLLGRWDRRNQRTLDAHSERDEVVEPGVVSIYSVPALIKIAVITVAVAVVLVVQGELWSYLAAPVALLIGGALCLGLARDARQDASDWRQRRAQRPPKGESSA